MQIHLLKLAVYIKSGMVFEMEVMGKTPKTLLKFKWESKTKSR